MDSRDGRKPFWKRLGYESEEEFWDEGDKKWDPLGIWAPKRSRKDIPDPSLPRGREPENARSLRPRSRQVNVKLTLNGYEELERAAGIYGVAPSTMAQVLVNRGVHAVLEED